MKKVTIWVSNKTQEVVLYHEKSKEIETDFNRYQAGKYMLSVFGVGWTMVGSFYE